MPCHYCRNSAFTALIVLAFVSTAHAGAFVVRPVTVDETKAVFGQVESRDTVAARARISGTIREVSVEEGSQVTAGETIAVVVDDKLALQRDAAEADIMALTSQLQNAQTDLERAQQLFAKAAGTKARVDQAQTQVDVYLNQLAAAKAKRDVIAQQTIEGDIVAPVSGRVLTVPAIKGSVVLAGDSVVRIAGGGYFLRLSLPERYASTIKQGGTVQVGRRVLSGDATAQLVEEGKLVKIYPEISDGKVLADVDVAKLGDYFVGERTLVWIPVGKRTMLSVPPDAVITRQGIDYVKLVTEGDPLEVAVVLGDHLKVDGEDRVEVLSGLRAGDRVLTP